MSHTQQPLLSQLLKIATMEVFEDDGRLSTESQAALFAESFVDARTAVRETP